MGETVIGDLVATGAFRRLQAIRFLGAIDYVLVRAPNQAKRRYTRYQHSLGVADLAHRYAVLAELSYEDRRLVCISALLHDIGHAPLSHSLEQVFAEHFGIDHHRATEDIVAGRVAIGREVHDTLKWHGIDVERVLGIIDGQDASFDGFFSGPINFDTVEGILRTIRYVANTPTATQPHAVIRAATIRADDRDRRVVDGFWMQKDFVYREIINARRGILADAVSQSHMKKNIDRFSSSDFFEDEPGLFAKLPALRAVLTAQDFLDRAEDRLDEPVAYKQRSFFIDEASAFQSRQDASRYRQKKSPAMLLPRFARTAHTADVDRGFFDDDTL